MQSTRPGPDMVLRDQQAIVKGLIELSSRGVERAYSMRGMQGVCTVYRSILDVLDDDKLDWRKTATKVSKLVRRFAPEK
jgi:hypothetical protein